MGMTYGYHLAQMVFHSSQLAKSQGLVSIESSIFMFLIIHVPWPLAATRQEGVFFPQYVDKHLVPKSRGTEVHSTGVS